MLEYDAKVIIFQWTQPSWMSIAEAGVSQTVWPDKNRQMSVKVAQNDFTRKIKDFDTFTKIA